MLVALFIVLFGGAFGSAPQGLGALMARHLQGPLKASVADDARRAAALRVLGRARDDIEVLNKEVAKDTAVVERLIRRYDSTSQDFDRLIDSALDQRQQQMERIWSHRAQLLSQVTREEWDQAIAAARLSRAAQSAPR
ncbi:MAG: hypothetical protein ACK53Z_13205 [Betaproteobacteria bacterium]|nr:hypothetical protein [Betaproteobacteria bacterium]